MELALARSYSKAESVALYVDAVFQDGIAHLARRDAEVTCGLGLHPAAFFQCLDNLPALRVAGLAGVMRVVAGIMRLFLMRLAQRHR